jgi:hypothetical protein
MISLTVVLVKNLQIAAISEIWIHFGHRVQGTVLGVPRHVLSRYLSLMRCTGSVLLELLNIYSPIDRI